MLELLHCFLSCTMGTGFKQLGSPFLEGVDPGTNNVNPDPE